MCPTCGEEEECPSVLYDEYASRHPEPEGKAHQGRVKARASFSSCLFTGWKRVLRGTAFQAVFSRLEACATKLSVARMDASLTLWVRNSRFLAILWLTTADFWQ